MVKGNPFDLEEPYEWVTALESEGKIRGNVLDLGCGAGHNGIFLVGKGYNVTGIDISSAAIERAKQKAVGKGNALDLDQANVCEPLGYEEKSDTVIDIGCFHSRREEDRAKYAVTLYRACRPGAAVFLKAFSDLDPPQEASVEGRIFSTPSVREDQLRRAFFQERTITSLEHKEIELGELGVLEKDRYRKNVWFARIDYNSTPALTAH